MRRSKYVGFLAICLGILFIVGAAVLPVTPATERFGPFRIDLRGDTCGPAGYVAFREANEVCKEAAHRRLLTTTGIGLLVLAMGMALFSGGDQRRGSMVVVPTNRVKRRSALRNRGHFAAPGPRRLTPKRRSATHPGARGTNWGP